MAQLMPDEPEVAGALALFLFQHSRRDTRRDSDGNLLTLDLQDRSRWDDAAIAEGGTVLAETSGDGPYVLQARIAACHATAASAAIAHTEPERRALFGRADELIG